MVERLPDGDFEQRRLTHAFHPAQIFITVRHSSTDRRARRGRNAAETRD
jgi:hypothetical protein